MSTTRMTLQMKVKIYSHSEVNQFNVVNKTGYLHYAFICMPLADRMHSMGEIHFVSTEISLGLSYFFCFVDILATFKTCGRKFLHSYTDCLYPTFRSRTLPAGVRRLGNCCLSFIELLVIKSIGPVYLHFSCI